MLIGWGRINESVLLYKYFDNPLRFFFSEISILHKFFIQNIRSYALENS